MKTLLSYDSFYLVLELSVSDSWPPFWYHKDKHGNRTYQFFMFGMATYRKNDRDWAPEIVFLPFHLIFAFPILTCTPEQRQTLKRQYINKIKSVFSKLKHLLDVR